MKEGDRDGSVWWKELVCIFNGVGLEVEAGLRRMFKGRLLIVKILFFFMDQWLEDMPFKRLFDLTENKWLADGRHVLFRVRGG